MRNAGSVPAFVRLDRLFLRQRAGRLLRADVAPPRRGPSVRNPQSSDVADGHRSEEHTSELQPLMRISYAVFCLKKKKNKQTKYKQYLTKIKDTLHTNRRHNQTYHNNVR